MQALSRELPEPTPRHKQTTATLTRRQTCGEGKGGAGKHLSHTGMPLSLGHITTKHAAARRPLPSCTCVQKGFECSPFFFCMYFLSHSGHMSLATAFATAARFGAAVPPAGTCSSCCCCCCGCCSGCSCGASKRRGEHSTCSLMPPLPSDTTGMRAFTTPAPAKYDKGRRLSGSACISGKL